MKPCTDLALSGMSGEVNCLAQCPTAFMQGFNSKNIKDIEIKINCQFNESLQFQNFGDYHDGKIDKYFVHNPDSLSDIL